MRMSDQTNLIFKESIDHLKNNFKLFTEITVWVFVWFLFFFFVLNPENPTTQIYICIGLNEDL